MSQVVNFNGLVDFTAKNCSSDFTKKQIADVLKAMLQAEIDILKSGDELRLVGHRSMKVVHKPESTGRNPQTGEAITIKARNAVKVSVGKAVKDAVNE